MSCEPGEKDMSKNMYQKCHDICQLTYVMAYVDKHMSCQPTREIQKFMLNLYHDICHNTCHMIYAMPVLSSFYKS